MSTTVTRRAGTAVRWRALQLAGSEGIYFLRLMILAQLLAPEAFGLLAIATIAIGMLMRLSDVGMIPALVHRRDATPSQHDAAWTVQLVRAGLVTAALVVTAPAVAALFGQPDATRIIQVLALRPLIDSSASIGTARLTRDLKFRELAFIYVPGAVVDTVVAVALAPLIGVWALVVGILAGSVTTTGLSYALAPHRPRLRFDWTEIAPLVNYGRWVLVTGVMTMAGTMLTQLAVSRTLGAAALGLFFLAVKLAYVPIDAANAVVGSVAFPVFSSLRDDLSASRRAFTTLLSGLWLLLLPLYALIAALAPHLETALGPRWAGTAPIVLILCLAAVTSIVGDLAGRLLMGRGHANRAFGIEALQTIVLLAALLPCLELMQLEGAALAWVLGAAATLVLSVMWLRRLLPGAFAAVRGRLLAGPVIAAAAGSVAYAVASPLGGWPGLIAGGASGIATGALVLWALDARFGLQLREFWSILRKRDE